MVARKNLKLTNKKSALISVYNKASLKKLCSTLKHHNIDIISTGETANKIKKLGYNCKKVSNITRFKEILNGRVKTLHPKIYASILFKRNNNKQLNEFKKLIFPTIDFVIINLYPFEKYKNAKHQKTIEMIDIGGVTLLRSAAKNYNFVTSICDNHDYDKLINNLKKNNGETSIDFRKKMAQKAFEKSANYDLAIARWFKGKNNKTGNKKLLQTKLKYGENPHQKAFLKYRVSNQMLKNLNNEKQLSYNNFLDLDAANKLLEEFKEPTCVIVKHNNPCGVCSAKTINLSFKKALDSDKKSAFGGIVGINRTVNYDLAKKLYANFFEVIIAKNFTKESINLLKNKKNLILVKTSKNKIKKNKEIRSINNGLLIQEQNNINIKISNLHKATKIKASKKIIDDLIFCLRVCKHVKSNAIVIGNNKQTLGIGAGQMSRIDATKIALNKISKKNKNNGFVVASDAFFPFTDSLKLLFKKNCKAVVQPSGSKNDYKIINFANKNNVPLYFSNFRFFKH